MMEWTPDVVETLVQLLKEGLPPKDIAVQLRCSKNSVLGKIFRLGLAEKGKTPRMVGTGGHLKRLEKVLPAVKAYLLGEEPDDANRINKWLISQRTHYRQGRMSPTRIAELEAIPGWSWGLQGEAKTDTERAKAIAQNRPKYIPERACIHGHMERYTGTGQCVECAKLRGAATRQRKNLDDDGNLIRKRRRKGEERYQAETQGLVRYQTAYPCKRGHTERYVSTGSCVQCTISRTIGRYNARKCQA